MGTKDATLQALRLKYNAALTAHQGCARALSEARLSGTEPAQRLVDGEARARAELDRARAALLAAMTESITGHPAPEPPPPPPRRRPDAS